MTNCSYSNPVTASGAIATSTENFQFASSTCITVTDVVSTTTDITITSNISAGEIVLSLVLLSIFILLLTVTIADALSTIPVFLKRKEK